MSYWNRPFCKQNSENRPSLGISLGWLKNVDFFLVREKKKPIRENFQKYMFSVRENKSPYVKKILNCAHETFGLPVKSGLKVRVKAFFSAWKNSKKIPKIRYAHTFDFHVEKKILPKGGCENRLHRVQLFLRIL